MECGEGVDLGSWEAHMEQRCSCEEKFKPLYQEKTTQKEGPPKREMANQK
jgi:hypothetical protein